MIPTRAVLVVTGVAVAVMVTLSLIGREGSRPQGRGEAPWPSPAVSAPATAVSAGPVGFLSGEGKSLVPEQVAPGTYMSAGPSGDTSCYAEATGPNGEHLHQEVQKGQTILTVPKEAATVVAHFCLPFEKVR